MEICLKTKDCKDGMGDDGEAGMLNKLYAGIYSNTSLTDKRKYEITDELF